MMGAGWAGFLLWFALVAAAWLGGCEGQTDRNAVELFLNSTGHEFPFNSSLPCPWGFKVSNQSWISCTGENVTDLHMVNMGLRGTIPNGSIAELHKLQKLDLSGNSLSGDIPDLSGLRNLSEVRLGSNNFSSVQLRFSPALTLLDLSRNSLNDTVPLALFNHSHLSILNLTDNRFSGSIRSISPSLRYVNLSNNRLSGEILGNFSVGNLTTFDIRGNNFTGNVTNIVEKMSSAASGLQVLGLSSNGFSLQALPSNFNRFTNLTELHLADNDFLGGHLPALPLQLHVLNLSDVNLTGPIPDRIVTISKLQRLDLSRNSLTGEIPTDLGSLQNLTVVDLSWNNLSGGIPTSITNLTLLTGFNVSYNNLTGAIPLSDQFITFTESMFRGNRYLCGRPLRACVNESSPADSNSNSNSNSSGKGNSKTVGVIVGLVLGILVILIVCAALFVWCRVSRAVKPLRDEPRHVSGPMQYEKDTETWATGVKDAGGIPVIMFERPLLNLTFADLMQACGNFTKEMQIADGGHGPVFKGVLPDTTQLAIKVLVDVRFFEQEDAAAKIEALARVKQSNVVPLIGYCIVGEDNVLIYDYMVNGDLQRWLHELPEGNRNPEDWSLDTWENPEGAEVGGEYLSWPTRHKVALGTARGLAFLHHGCSPPIVHGDVKSSNVLLDENFRPHLVDCGLAGMAKTKGTLMNGGTCGYVPPEYAQAWQPTPKGDVYSFGVVLLELVTGRKPTGRYFHDSYGGHLVGWVRSTIRLDKRGQKALDQKLVSRGNVSEMLETLRIGYLCTAENPSKRPSMQQVVGLLKDCESVAVA